MAQKRFSQGPGPSQRQLRVGELIRRRLSEVLGRGDIHDPELNRMLITVGEVRASPDLKVATAYVSPLGGQGREEALAALRRNRGELRHLVASALALKYAPELRFAHDETFDRLDETRRLFAQEAVRRDLEAEEHEMDSDTMQETDREALRDTLPEAEGERDPTAPLRDIREDLPRRSDRDSDTIGGASDWDDADDDKLTDDFDPYRTGDDGAEPLDRLIRPDAPASAALDRMAMGEAEDEEDPDAVEDDDEDDEDEDDDLDEDDEDDLDEDDDLDDEDDLDDDDLDDDDDDMDDDDEDPDAEEDDIAPPRPAPGARAH